MMMMMMMMKRRTKMCRSIGARTFESVGLCVLLLEEKTKEKSASIEALFFGCVFSRVFFSPSKRYKKKDDYVGPSLPRTIELRRLSLSLLSPSLLIQSCAESCCRSIRPVKTWTF